MPIAIYDAVSAGRWEAATLMVLVLSAVAVIVLMIAGRLGAAAA
jgi:ABC-type molybdate transport system permease subunit